MAGEHKKKSKNVRQTGKAAYTAEYRRRQRAGGGTIYLMCGGSLAYYLMLDIGVRAR